MGFLSGVLEAVKDDDAVKTYDNYMDKKLSEVLKELNSKIGSGREGLAVSVAEVREWLEGYGKKLNEQINAVKDPINEILIDNTNENSISHVVNIFKQLMTREYDEYIVSTSLGGMHQLPKQAEKIKESLTALNNIDNNLKNKLTKHVESIEQAINIFKQNAANDYMDLREVCGNVNLQIGDLHKEINEAAKAAEKVCITELTTKFDDTIKKPLLKITKDLQQVFLSLNTWITVTRELLGPAIMKTMEVRDKLNPVGGTEALKKQIDEMNAVRQAIEYIHDQLSGIDGNLIKWIQKAKPFVDASLVLVKDIFAEINEKGNKYPGKIRMAAQKLYDDANTLFEVMGQAHGYISGQLGSALSAMKTTLNDAFKADLKCLREAIKGTVGRYVNQLGANIKDELKALTDGIYKNPDGDGHINKIVKGFQEYAEGFSIFENKLHGWVKDIISKNEVVKKKLGDYVSGNDKLQPTYTYPSANGINEKLVDVIAAAMRDHLRDVVLKDNFESFNVKPTENIVGNVQNVKQACEEFAKHLEEKLKTYESESPGIVKIATNITKAIEDKLFGQNHSSSLKLNLNFTVQAMLPILAAMARESGAAVELFTTTDRTKSGKFTANVKQAINAIKNLGDNFSNRLKTGSTLGTLAANLKSGAEERINKGYGESGDVHTGGNGFKVTYNGASSSVITTLTNIQTNSHGLDSIQNVNSTGKPGEMISKQHLKAFYNEVTNSLEYLIETIKQKTGQHKHETDGLRFKLSKLTDLIIRSDEVAVSRDLSDKVSGLTKIKSEFNSHITQLYSKPGEIDNVITTMTATLESLRGTLNTDVIQKMEELIENGMFKSNVWNNTASLRKIGDDIDKIIGDTYNDFTLVGIIEESRKFRSICVPNAVKHCLKAITSKMAEQVDTKIKAIQKHALNRFAASKAQELDDLKTLITYQLTKMTAIIETDAASGTKGLLRTMRTHRPSLSEIANQSELRIASSKLQWYFERISDFMKGEVSVIEAGTFKPTKDSQLVADLQSRTYALLSHLHTNNRTFTFDSKFRSRLHDLTTYLSTFDPATFANPQHPQLLDALKAGMRGLVGEMEKAYVNRYDSQKIEWSKTLDPKFEPTVDATRCAKVFMSCLPMLLNDLRKVKERCVERGEWSNLKINTHPKNRLGPFLKSCGYSVASDVPLQDGELQNSSKMKGENIHGILNETILISNRTHVPQCKPNGKEHNFIILDFIKCLNDHLDEFYRVNHYATFTASKHPSTICDMLQWLTGLTHSPVYDALSHDGFSGLFEKKDEQETDNAADGFTVKFDDDDKLPAYPETITATNMRGTLTLVCHHAEETLISFLGHGHSGGIYACEFNTNLAKLTYPSDPSKCLDLLFEVISRVYNQLFFLFKQCSYNTKLGGWYDCWYGQGVGGSAWNCNTLQCPGQSTDQKAGQEHNQKCNQKCDQTAGCGLKSPLQSFLEDGLPGFLPHPYSKSNCKPTCTAPGHFGKVCITPMGFGDISGMASRRQQGRHIMDVLRDFCGSEHAPLSRLCGLLTCLLTRPPQTLGDMFAFYYNFLNDSCGKNPERTKHRALGYAKAVKEANFNNADANPLDVTSMFKSVYHKFTPKSTHPTGDLFSLVSCDQPMAENTYCGRYLQPCGQHIWTVFSEKHAGNYLSWIVYLTETFYDLLKMLYDDCNNKCGQERSKCYLTSCTVDCKTKLSSESKTPIPDKCHNSKCNTIVTCKSSLPTFCRYGFVFDSPQSLSGEYGDDKKRTCKDFCRALNIVLSDDKKENDALSKLKFDTIPTFLWNIRSKFFWTTVALWSLSLFYLICVMVGRLDVLHIRSHLRIPSSHKITAQSLLAAAQVGRLAKISYLQP